MATTKDTIIKNYKKGLWTDDMLAKLVVKGKLSAMDYAEITGSSIMEAELTEANIQRVLTNAVQAYMDSKAQERGYDDILKAISYRGDTVNSQFAEEAEICFAWRSAVWTKCYAILADVKALIRPIPTIDELIAELPPLVW